MESGSGANCGPTGWEAVLLEKARLEHRPQSPKGRASPISLGRVFGAEGLPGTNTPWTPVWLLYPTGALTPPLRHRARLERISLGRVRFTTQEACWEMEEQRSK